MCIFQSQMASRDEMFYVGILMMMRVVVVSPMPEQIVCQRGQPLLFVRRRSILAWSHSFCSHSLCCCAQICALHAERWKRLDKKGPQKPHLLRIPVLRPL